ncbi:outer membrane porin GjpA [Mycobacterium sp.]|uniref:outer membrane porin GjpA n=1 Tax=Mycobacterium sp. TaxID=1785 RepID=UPI0031E3BDAB
MPFTSPRHRATTRRATTGVVLAALAAVGVIAAGVIAISPIPPPTPGRPDVDVAAVELSAAANTDVFFSPAFPALQQTVVTPFDYVGELLTNPGMIGDVAAQVESPAQYVFAPAPLIGPPSGEAAKIAATGLPGDNVKLVSGLGAGSVPADLQMMTAFAASPASGVLMGALGPFISPVVALGNSIDAVAGALGAGDYAAAAHDVATAPADVGSSVLNGATLNLDGLIPLLTAEGAIPQGDTLTSLDITFGGLLTPAVNGATSQPVDGAGGSILDAISYTAMTSNGPETVTGYAVGPVGALPDWTHLLDWIIGLENSAHSLDAVSAATIVASAAADISALPTP